ncbi:MAG TPA: ribosome-associated translation inhibitor RaiA [Alphaproteobacteria bacterium]|jgi:ribosomal subunit interface protein|nr:ribosome-associated translation inhibitor RaiA [Alphaproteobacteria bacterium]
MLLSVSGKHIDVSDSLRAHVDERLSSAVGKYFDRAIDSKVQFSKARHLYRSDISVHAGRGIRVQAHGEANNIQAAFDAAADRVEKRLRRYHRRLTDHHAEKFDIEPTMSAAQTVLAAEHEDAAEPEFGADGPVTIAETTMPVHTLTVSAAVMRLELEDVPVLIFRNSGHGRLNVVYRRGDGNIGWLDPKENG